MRPNEVERQLASLGVRRGSVLVVHTSFRAVGPLEGGPACLIAALENALGPEGTLVMPTMTDGATAFDPRTTPTHEMGIVAETFWRMPGVLRSTHPGGSFAAKGPRAERICAPQPLSPPHGRESPPGRVLELDGDVLLLGVRFSECTMLHVAESIAGVPYSVVYPTVLASGETVGIAETDHCCRGFRKVEDWLDPPRRSGGVGHADAMLAPAQEIVRVALARLSVDPLVFLCAPDSGCVDCASARRSAHA